MIKVIINTKDFDISDEINAIHKNGEIGAISSFIGLVRDFDDKSLIKMQLECYVSMAEKTLNDIAILAQTRWEVSNIIIHHRIGKLQPNEQIVLVIATSKHREDAFNACYFIMDYLKTNAPFWKKETSKNNDNWVEANIKDEEAKQKWC
jgi:molybdopterin synthase catalytic subunit